MSKGLEEYIIVFHFKPGTDSAQEQAKELDKAKEMGLNVTVLEREVFDTEEIPVPSLYLVAAYTDKEPEVVDHKQGTQTAETIMDWIAEWTKSNT